MNHDKLKRQIALTPQEIVWLGGVASPVADTMAINYYAVATDAATTLRHEFRAFEEGPENDSARTQFDRADLAIRLSNLETLKAELAAAQDFAVRTDLAK